jgi:hypothetical protein
MTGYLIFVDTLHPDTGQIEPGRLPQASVWVTPTECCYDTGEPRTSRIDVARARARELLTLKSNQRPRCRAQSRVCRQVERWQDRHGGTFAAAYSAVLQARQARRARRAARKAADSLSTPSPAGTGLL